MSLDRSDIASWIPGYSYATNDITIDRTAEGGLGDKGLSAAEAAHDDEGDIGEVLRTIMECVYQHMISVPASQRPEKVRLTKSSGIDPVTGQIDKIYTLRLNCSSGDVNVLPEPTEE
jgi:hypothetical protein